MARKDRRLNRACQKSYKPTITASPSGCPLLARLAQFNRVFLALVSSYYGESLTPSSSELRPILSPMNDLKKKSETAGDIGNAEHISKVRYELFIEAPYSKTSDRPCRALSLLMVRGINCNNLISDDQRTLTPASKTDGVVLPKDTTTSPC